MPHIVDVLIEERAETLMQRPLLWRLVRRFLYPVIGYRQAVELIDHVQAMTGQQIFDYMCERLGLRLEVRGSTSYRQPARPLLRPTIHPASPTDSPYSKRSGQCAGTLSCSPTGMPCGRHPA